MKWTKVYLEKLSYPSFKYHEDLDFSAETFSKALNLLELKDVQVEGNAKYDSYQECLMLDLSIKGIMVVPCARTLQPIEYPFEIKESVTYTFVESDDEDAIYVKGVEIDTYEFVRECIVLAVPLRVVKEGTDDSQFAKKQDQEVDPRLAKLKDFFKD